MAFSQMMRHYLQTKENYKDCIVLYRLGDFYEMFFEDAEKASKILDLVLTRRDCGDNQRAPMCGVPYHAVDAYIAKLIASGNRVAICEQLSAPNGRELVVRDVVRIVTPGTVMETSILDEKRSNFVACLYHTDNSSAIAICDISTGYFAVCEFEGISILNKLQEFLVSFSPSEVLANSNGMSLGSAFGSTNFTQFDDSHFDFQRAKNLLLRHYKIANLSGFGLGKKNAAVCACGALMQFLVQTQKRDLPHLDNIRYIDDKQFMSIDAKTRRNLELTSTVHEGKRKGSLLWLLDKTSTSMGGRKLFEFVERPLQSVSEITRRLDGVDELFSSFILRDQLTQLLQEIKDIERLSGKIAYDIAMPRDLFALKQSISVLPKLKAMLDSRYSKIICELNTHISSLSSVYNLIDSAIFEETDEQKLPSTLKDGGYFKKGFNEQLDSYIDLSENGSKHISKLEEYERNRTGIRTLKLGYNKVFGYYFEVSNSFKDKMPSDFIRKQTLTNGERFISEQLKVLEEQLLDAKEKRQALERELYTQLRTDLLPFIPEIQSTSRAIAELDCLLSLAKVAAQYNYVKPKISATNAPLNIVEGRHPIVEVYVKSENFISNDTFLDTKENRTMVITGPNMAGKSTYMRQVALITLMAHIGSFVPAKSCEIPLIDKIFTRVGASDDLAFNQSTFMVEMTEIANILTNATQNSLLILDEVGRGTSTFDGLSIAWAIMEYISKNISAKTLFATHFHELTELEGRVEGVKNFKITVKEHSDGIIFLHKILRGGANKSFGIEVAALAGVPNTVCDRAREIVKLLDNSDISYKIGDIGNPEIAQEPRCDERQLKEIADVLKNLNMNKCTPIEAFEILNELVERLK